ncbi:MAG: hypothetical protein AVDCRST_MAG30-1097 [uncultured Solirubrobacteraceae bacterium]|uniref:histidine kinase n=1 Tax=uncultured Solirubrobacteraceae bacterium TaxID=1162706 RepID=A0A6J4S103_9ACTN|nr:MAG: hypothetical protein AVDCRST_MAG30-1097 [uncultured Solirubrobacteraceae bacterium]
MTVLTVVLAAGVAAGYFTIAALILPRFQVEGLGRRFIAYFRVGGIAFFLGCGLTHTHIAVHAATNSAPVALHEVVFHLMQVFGVWVFILVAMRTIDIRIVRRPTEAERAAKALEAEVENLSRSNADLEHFARIVAHDLREPLSSVAGFGQLLAERSRGRIEGEDAAFVGYMVDGCRQMSGMLDGILEYSRTASAELAAERVDLGELVAEVEAALTSVIEEAGATVHADALPVVQGDRVQLRRLLQNLISNAVKFRGDDPPEVHVSAEAKDGGWILSVADNGIGVDPAHERWIFQIFKRAGAQDRPGTGVGLAVCEKIVLRHGGRLWVEPRPGGGSVFRFTLPVIAAAPEPAGDPGLALSAR